MCCAVGSATASRGRSQSLQARLWSIASTCYRTTTCSARVTASWSRCRARGSQSLTATRKHSCRTYSRQASKTSGWLRSGYLPRRQRHRRSSCPCCKTQHRHSNEAAHAIVATLGFEIQNSFLGWGNPPALAGVSGRIVGNPYLTGLGKSCPSFRNNAARRRYPAEKEVIVRTARLPKPRAVRMQALLQQRANLSPGSTNHDCQHETKTDPFVLITSCLTPRASSR